MFLPLMGGAARAQAPALATLPHDLSPWGMFVAADNVVKAVMASLALASFLTWTIWFAKGVELALARRAARRAAQKLEGAADLAAASRDLAESKACCGAIRQLLAAARREIEHSGGLDTGGLAPGGIKERLAISLAQIETRAGREMARGTGLLATFGSTAPFVGLFGTVWGIMNSFIGISHAKTTNLAVVAPGIAEALLATAIGLAAAIPAVMAYNALVRALAAYRAHLSEVSGEILRHVSRDLERREAGGRADIPARQAVE